MAVWRMPVNLTYGNGGGPGVNIWHLRDLDGTPGEAQTLVDSLHSFYTAVMTTGVGGAGIFQNNTTASASELINVDTQETQQINWTDILGPGVTTSLPPANQICISWRTSIAARRGMGRTFLGPLGANAQESNGTIAAAVLDLVRGAASDLVSASLTDGNGAFGVYGLQSSGGTARVLRDFTGSAVQDKFAVLRSRRD